MPARDKIRWIEAWKLIDAYQLTPQEFNLLRFSIDFSVSNMWAALSLKNGLFSLASEGHEHAERILGRPTLANLRVMDALIEATSQISKDDMRNRIIELIDMLFDDSRTENSRSAIYKNDATWFVNDLYARERYEELGEGQLGKDYILVGHGDKPCMTMEAYKFYDKIFSETLLINKFKAVQLLYDWGYPLHTEVKGISHALVERIVSGNAPKIDFEKALVTGDPPSQTEGFIVDTITIAAWGGAISTYESQGAKRGNDALPRRMRLLLRKLGGEAFSILEPDSHNLTRDLKLAREKDVPKLAQLFPTLPPLGL